MPYAFNHLDVIEEIFAASPHGLISDIDGTISEIVLIPEEARVSAVCHEQLDRLRSQLDLVAIVSGRAAARAKAMINLDGIVYIGNHGLERITNDTVIMPPLIHRYVTQLQKLEATLASQLTGEEIQIENKGPIITLHYRRAPQPAAAARIMAALKSSPLAASLKINQGRMAIEVRPPLEINKGTASLDLIGEYGLRRAIYIGDDRTDLDAFRAIHQASVTDDFRGLALGVTSPEMPAGLTEEADFTLNGVKDVARFLTWLADSVTRSN